MYLLPILILSTFEVVRAWPDGAPCVHAAFESMNPLEAVEHSGGLQLSEPPYEIVVDQQCYWRNQPIGVTLQGKNSTVKFKGFVMQPFEYWNGQTMGRIGQLMRLDDNGSWQQQCFTKKTSATHSHDEWKKHIKLWWKNEDESRTVQFVATVVHHIKKFWVKSVVSRPIPPCRQSRSGIQNWTPQLPTQPPPVKAFKLETHRVFGSGGFQRAPFRNESMLGLENNEISVDEEAFGFLASRTTSTILTTTTRITTTPPPRPTTTRQILSHRAPMRTIIPVNNMELIHSSTLTRNRVRPHQHNGGDESVPPRNERPRRPLVVSGTMRRPQQNNAASQQNNAASQQNIASSLQSGNVATLQQIRPTAVVPPRPQLQQTPFVPQQTTQQQSFVPQQQSQVQQQQFQQQQQFAQFQQRNDEAQRAQFFRQQQLLRQQQLQQQLQLQQQQRFTGSTGVCQDFDIRCPTWAQHCLFNAFVAQRCPRTCGLCR